MCFQPKARSRHIVELKTKLYEPILSPARGQTRGESLIQIVKPWPSHAQELSAEFLRGLTDESEAAAVCGGGSLDGFERSSVKDGSEMAEEADADDKNLRVRTRAQA